MGTTAAALAAVLVGAAPAGAAETLVGVPADPSPAEVEEYLAFVTSNLDQVWSDWFVGRGLPEPDTAVFIIGPGESFQSSCADETGAPAVVTADYNNLFYCPSDTGQGADGEPAVGGVVLPVLTLQRIWTGDILGIPSNVPGDFAAAVAVAHEFGHSVVDELATDQGIAFPVGKNDELIADCFAGVWTARVEAQGLLEAGDLEEGLAALEAVGDPPGIESHGTPEERMQALTAGHSTGLPATCIDTYWTT